jgi:acetate kinase
VERIDGEAIITVQSHTGLRHKITAPIRFLAAMGGADAVVFTGRIGEHSPEIRARVCADLEWAGLKIDAGQNRETVGREGRISTEGSPLHAWVIPTSEELRIARDTLRCILGGPHPS